MSDPRSISILDFDYPLPEDRIALRPLEQRDASRLLIWQDGVIREDRFTNLCRYLPEGSLTVFNQSKVIPARLLFPRPGGGSFEIFCLEPCNSSGEYGLALGEQGASVWKCLVGGLARWKSTTLTRELSSAAGPIVLTVERLEKASDHVTIRFRWTPEQHSFAEILSLAGDIPLPPYIRRTTEPADQERYQTIYARDEGSVAAPTAGLHFTEKMFADFSDAQIGRAFVTLHVGAGTFKPVKSDTLAGHEMHAEWMEVDTATLKRLRDHKGLITAVGTTSLRTLESLYWMGVKAGLDPEASSLEVRQWDVYEESLSGGNQGRADALEHLLRWMERKRVDRIFSQTQLLITPGYRFRVCGALVTNFHQPRSTLLLLVAAVTGDAWRSCYDYALQQDFRFLSYGDGSLLFMAE